MRWAAVVVLALSGFGCGPPKPYQGLIKIDHRGLAARMQALCRLGLAPGETADACKPEPKQVTKPVEQEPVMAQQAPSPGRK